MATLTDFIVPVSLGATVVEQTGVTGTGYTAGAYAAWIQSITGSVPKVVKLPGRRAKLVLTDEQQKIMHRWLDSQLKSYLAKPSKPPALEFELGPVFGPWALKYAVPLAVAFLVLGWIGHYYIAR